MPDFVGGTVRSAELAQAALAAMDKRVDLGTAAGIKKVQQITKSSVKSGMRGRPRYDRRGRSRVYAMGVNLNLNPHVVKKSGGPGRFAGALFKSIRGSKRPRKVIGGYSAVVFSGGAGGPQNLYKKKVEQDQPYFKPGVERAKPKMPAVWHAAWAKATKTK